MGYDRTVHLLPPDTTPNEERAVLEAARSSRQSVVWSADDAFLKAEELDERNVTVWDVERITHTNTEHQGGVELERWVANKHPPIPYIEYRRLSELLPFSFRAWPTNHRVVTQRFGANPDFYRKYNLRGHEGVDIRALTGTPIYAVADGLVYRTETVDNSNYGLQVRIAHKDGWKTVYAHAMKILVRPGERVVAGQRIAQADSTGNVIGGASHLHLTLKRTGHSTSGYPANIMDPTPFLERFNPSWP